MQVRLDKLRISLMSTNLIVCFSLFLLNAGPNVQDRYGQRIVLNRTAFLAKRDLPAINPP